MSAIEGGANPRFDIMVMSGQVEAVTLMYTTYDINATGTL